VYAVRWEGRSGKTGYSPAGDKEWDHTPSSGRGPKKSFRITKLFALNEEVIRDHLLGKQTIGVYPLLADDTCWFVAVDFDKSKWEADACAFLKMCHETGVPASLERSRSGNGGHVWIFFQASPGWRAHLDCRNDIRGLDSYDPCFKPGHDAQGRIRSLIAAPQHGPREAATASLLRSPET
jgi:hypothetical protein